MRPPTPIRCASPSIGVTHGIAATIEAESAEAHKAACGELQRIGRGEQQTLKHETASRIHATFSPRNRGGFEHIIGQLFECGGQVLRVAEVLPAKSESDLGGRGWRAWVHEAVKRSHRRRLAERV